MNVKMRPRKRDLSEPVECTKSQYEHVQTDHELFLQAFEKPTQIYRYLRARNLHSPIFLQRTVSYMVGRCKRKNKSRIFHINDLLAKVEEIDKKNETYSYKSDYMNLSFSGFFYKDDRIADRADVDVTLKRMCHKKRKDVSSPVIDTSIGHVVVPCNPNLDEPLDVPSISVSSNTFSVGNSANSMKTYILSIKVICKTKSAIDISGKTERTQDSENQSPPKKKLRSSKDSFTNLRTNEETTDELEEGRETITYSAELVVYDKHRRCFLTDGEYEVELEEHAEKPALRKTATWETVMDGKSVIPFELFTKCPSLKFKLSWSKYPLNYDVICPTPPSSTISDEVALNNYINMQSFDAKMCEKSDKRMCGAGSPSKKRRIFYQFLYNNNTTRQQTESRDDRHCPWCFLDCIKLSALLNHLRCCHARFNFIYIDHPNGGRIDVSINDSYDGSYVGNPQDLHSHIGYAFSRNGPIRRMSVTQILVNRRPKKPSLDLMEFFEPEFEGQKSRQIVQGHNRLYYHTLTCQPIHPSDIDIDSEGENDPNWLRQKTQHMIDEFTDVNEGEKEVMKLWNLHVMHHNYISDCQISTACTTFVEEHGQNIVRNNLSRNLLLHLVSLFDFGLISSKVLQRTSIQLLRLCRQIPHN